MARFDAKAQLSRELLAELYVEQSLSADEIAKQLGCGETTVFRALEEYGIPRRSKHDYRLEIAREELERLYIVEQLSESEIAERFDTSQRTVSRRLIELGIPTRPTGSVAKWLVPSSILSAWSSELAYVVGLIATDGYLDSEKSEVCFTSTDGQLIDLYCQALHVDSIHVGVTENRDRKPCFRVRLNDHDYRRFLENIGLTPAKSKTLGALQIPDDFFRDFLRGVLDGDGSWYIQKSWLGRYQYLKVELVSASYSFIEWINHKISTLAGLRGTTRSRSLGRYHYLSYGGHQSIDLGTWLYYSSDVLALSRKRIIWEQMRNRTKSRSRT